MSHETVLTERVGEKDVPLLVWPDGSRIHLMPYKFGDGFQDPTEQLRRWLNAWRQPLVDALYEIETGASANNALAGDIARRTLIDAGLHPTYQPVDDAIQRRDESRRQAKGT